MIEINLNDIKTKSNILFKYYSEFENWETEGLRELKILLNDFIELNELEFMNIIQILKNLIERIENSKINYPKYEELIEKINDEIQKI